jgi:hypothetical protein
MALKWFLIAALSVVVFVIAWVAVAVWCLYYGHPILADAMNDIAAVALIVWLARVEK